MSLEGRAKKWADVPAFEQLDAYWRRLQNEAGGRVPLRSAFNPARISQALPFIFLFKKITPDNFEIRLCGTAIDELMGASLTGQNYFDVCPRSEQEFFKDMFHQALTRPCAMRLRQEAAYPDGKALVLYSRIFPLAEEDGTPEFLIGTTVAERKLTLDERNNGPISRYEAKGYEAVDIGFGAPEPHTK